jgi:hypothetical protein
VIIDVYYDPFDFGPRRSCCRIISTNAGKSRPTRP